VITANSARDSELQHESLVTIINANPAISQTTFSKLKSVFCGFHPRRRIAPGIRRHRFSQARGLPIIVEMAASGGYCFVTLELSCVLIAIL
jgi:hypothetical protein